MRWIAADCHVLILLLLVATAAPAQTSVDGQVLHADSISVRGFSISDIACRPLLQNHRLSFSQIEATCYRGRLMGTIDYDLDNGDLHLDLQVRNLAIHSLALATGSDADIDGLLDADLRISLPTAQWQAARGRIDLHLQHGSLLNLPGLTDLLLEGDSSRGLDSGSARLLVADGRIVIERLRIDNPAVRVKAGGHIGLDGSLDVTLNPMAKAGLLRNTPLVGWLIGNMVRELTRGAFRIQVGGHITAPTFRTKL